MFKSTRGLKQGDPLSLTLFILVAEVLSRSLNALMEQKEFKRFEMPRRSPKIIHMAFADGMIILCKAGIRTMQLIATTLDRYEKASGQKVNKDKSAIYMHHKVSGGDVINCRNCSLNPKKRVSFQLSWLPCFFIEGSKRSIIISS